jgi:two-component SAPR family response regulator
MIPGFKSSLKIGIGVAIEYSVMKKIILCSSNTLLVKSLYGMLRDEGHFVETIEHPSFAVQMILRQQFDFLIIDSEPFGLSSEDAVEIIKRISPGMRILFIGSSHHGEAEVDLEELKQTIDRIAV